MRREVNNILAKVAQLASAVIVCGFTTLSALGQMGSTSTYSELWADQNGNLYGCGVTDETYNSYNHQARVISTLTSPNGRSASTDTGYTGSYACASVYLSFDENDVGCFNLGSDHYSYCPVVFQELFNGSTFGQDICVERKQYTYKKDFEHHNGTQAQYSRCNPPYEPCRIIDVQTSNCLISGVFPQYVINNMALILGNPL